MQRNKLCQNATHAKNFFKLNRLNSVIMHYRFQIPENLIPFSNPSLDSKLASNRVDADQALPRVLELPVKPGRRRKSIAMKCKGLNVELLPNVFIEVPAGFSEQESRRFLDAHPDWILKSYLKLYTHWVVESDGNLSSNQPGDFGFLAKVVALNETEFTKDFLAFMQKSVFKAEVMPLVMPLTLGRLSYFGNARHLQLSINANSQSEPNFTLDAQCLVRLKTHLQQTLRLSPKIADKAFIAWWQLWMPVFKSMQFGFDLGRTKGSESAKNHNTLQSPVTLNCRLPNLPAGKELSEASFAQAMQARFMMVAWQWLVQFMLGKLYYAELEDYLRHRLPELASKLGVRYQNFSVRAYKSRWGSCKSDGTLQFNWRILQAPSWVIDHLLIHELSHLRHANHSSAFWRMVYAHDAKTDQAKGVLKASGRDWIDFLSLVY